jgi:hypothetical protein
MADVVYTLSGKWLQVWWCLENIRCFVHLVHAPRTLCRLEDAVGILREFVTRGKVVEEGICIGDWRCRQYAGQTILGCSIAVEVSGTIRNVAMMALTIAPYTQAHVARRVAC